MRCRAAILLFCCFVLNLVADPLSLKFKLMEKSTKFQRLDVVQGKRADSKAVHTVVFSIKQMNINVIEAELVERSNPTSSRFGQHMTEHEVAALSSSPTAIKQVKKFLRDQNIGISKSTTRENFIYAEATVGQWEELFSTSFYEFHFRENSDYPGDTTGKTFVRSLEYSLPEFLTDYVEAVFCTVQFPVRLPRGKTLHVEPVLVHQRTPQSTSKETPSKLSPTLLSPPSRPNGGGEAHLRGPSENKPGDYRKDFLATNYVTPSLINTVYNIPSNVGSNRTSQGVYAAILQTMSPTDLTAYQNTFNLPVSSIAQNIGGHVDNSACVADLNNCVEANLDVQVIMAVAQNVPTTFYYWDGDDAWLAWLVAVANMTSPPHLFSISYGGYEASYSTSYLTAFNTQALKLAVIGVTLLAASGDDGVVGFLGRSTILCGYYASFPASSPYVTAVGGTMVGVLLFVCNTVLLVGLF
jgi:subtilase family serine protease